MNCSRGSVPECRSEALLVAAECPNLYLCDLRAGRERGGRTIVFWRKSGESPRQSLRRYSSEPAPRTAVPEAVAAAPAQLRALAGAARAGQLRLRHAVIALCRVDCDWIDEPERDYLWEAFGVPAFVQVLSPSLELLASECDAHWGLHVCSYYLLDRLTLSQLDFGVCACGRDTPRLMEARPAVARRRLVLAASR